MKYYLNHIVLFAFLIAFIYSIQFDVFLVSTKKILMIIGLVYSLPYILSKQWRLKNEYKQLFKYLYILIAWDVLISVINLNTEFHIIKTVLPVIGSVFAAEFIFEYSRKNNLSRNGLLKMIMATVLLESILSVLMYVFPPVFTFVDSILDFQFGDENMETVADRFRLNGIGNAKFFGVLTSASLGMMSSLYFYQISDTLTKKTCCVISWIVIFLTSFLTARWAITLGAVSVFLFVKMNKEKGVFSTIFKLMLFSFFLLYVIFQLISLMDEKFAYWAFSFITDHEAGDTGSSDTLLMWLKTTSFEIKTLLLGDARYIDPAGGYYMHVDIGIFRQIFYGGIFFLVYNLYTHWQILRKSIAKGDGAIYRYMLSALFLSYLVILFKGDTDMMTYFLLIMVFATGGIFQNKINTYEHT